MRINLDNCCFNRPFDDQSQFRIRLEPEAKLKIQSDIENRKFELVWSYILDPENAANPFEERSKSIQRWRKVAEIVVKEDAAILKRGNRLKQMGLRSKDALHIACAISAGCEFFITTDDNILNKKELIPETNLTEPGGFIKEVDPYD